MDAVKELRAIHALLEKAQLKAKATVTQEADDDDCCCEYCMDLRAMLEGIDNAQFFAADAIDAERAYRKAEAEEN